MQLLEQITVDHSGVPRSLKLYVGDLTSLPENEAVDVLVVSAFPDDYLPTPGSLVGALHRAGVSVSALARDKEVDLRAFSSCWLSRPLRQPDLHFKRILCFEPSYRGRAPELVGDIFRSIIPFTAGPSAISTMAMPLVASGDRGEAPEVMMEALVEAAVRWFSAGLTLDCIKVVLHDSPEISSLRGTFAGVGRRCAELAGEEAMSSHDYDVFVSYSRKDEVAAEHVVTHLKQLHPSLRIFMDRLELQTGAAWQQHIFESLDVSRKVICMFSPDYLASKVCVEEFNIALMRHREEDGDVLLPLYLRSVELPGYMRMLQYVDAREGEAPELARSSHALAALVEG